MKMLGSPEYDILDEEEKYNSEEEDNDTQRAAYTDTQEQGDGDDYQQQEHQQQHSPTGNIQQQRQASASAVLHPVASVAHSPSQPVSFTPPSSSTAVFSCQLDACETLSSILSCLQLDNRPSAAWSTQSISITSSPLLLRCQAMSAGLKFTVNKSRTLSARAYVKSALFLHYQLKEGLDEFAFTVSLHRFLSILSIFSPESRLYLECYSDDEKIQLTLEEAGVVCECEMMCVSDEAAADDQDVEMENSSENGGDAQILDFRAFPVIVRMVLKSAHVRALLTDLDLAGVQYLTMLVQSSFPRLRLGVIAPSLGVLVSLDSLHKLNPAERHDDVLAEFMFSCSSPVLRVDYPIALLKPCLRVLALAAQTNIRVNEAGVLSMQHVINTKMEGVSNWVEIICAAREGEIKQHYFTQTEVQQEVVD